MLSGLSPNDSSCDHTTKRPAPSCLYLREAICHCTVISVLRLQLGVETTNIRNIVVMCTQRFCCIFCLFLPGFQTLQWRKQLTLDWIQTRQLPNVEGCLEETPEIMLQKSAR